MRNDILNTIQNIDCLEGFKMLPDKSIDLIFTDPPYGLNKIGSIYLLLEFYFTLPKR